MSWILFLIGVFMVLGLSTRLSERAKHIVMFLAIAVTVGVVYISFASPG